MTGHGTGLALRTTGLVKRFGRVVALDGLDLAVPRGSICGLVGPNGAGKTTAFGVVGGFLRPDAGAVDLLGEGPFDAHRHAGRVTLLPQDCELSRHTSARDLLIYYARLQGLSSAEAAPAADRALAAVDLSERGAARVQHLSHGMRRRLQVAQALLGDPELILLDEPMSGLDPELVAHMRAVFTTGRGQRTLLISSHNLPELEAICDHVIFIDAGRCMRSGPLGEVTGRGLFMRYRLEREVDLAVLGRRVEDFALSWDAAEGVLTAQAPPGLSAADINAKLLGPLAEAGARIVEIRAGRSLESTYIETRSSGASAER